ncbi:DUF4097 family beta strand repeat-containing protein [Tumebacillus flagellatus]|uniref:DUF4097 domain-containing protein n=1 Tax=Tumebacillus flagellatus TaxID=1157490 RepID=A0A074LHV3_9BACL|nr:DUF4097 family beta strand repeat-containing protein [Tumebacillus flagellatus]KEO81811.1 hypothetical protein EL26_18385 [Tumebacillus flagellatus]
MKNWQRNLALFGVLVVGLGAAGFFGLRAWSSSTYDETQTVEAAAVKTISVDVSSADVHIIPGLDSQATAHFYGKGRADAYGLEVKTNGDNLIIQITHPSGFIGFGPQSLGLEITLPQKQYDRLEIHSGSGNTKLQDLKVKTLLSKTGSGNQDIVHTTADSIQLDTGSGDLTVDQTSAVLDLHTASGDILGRRINSPKVTTNCASGNVTLDGLTGEVNAQAASGNIELSYDKLNGNVNAHTASGNITLILPSDSSFHLNHHSSSGDFRSDFALTNLSSSEHRHEGTVGSGGPTLTIENNSGNLNVRKK